MRRMCEYLKKEEGERYMSLKAAPYAVESIENWGFMRYMKRRHFPEYV